VRGAWRGSDRRARSFGVAVLVRAPLRTSTSRPRLQCRPLLLAARCSHVPPSVRRVQPDGRHWTSERIPNLGAVWAEGSWVVSAHADKGRVSWVCLIDHHRQTLLTQPALLNPPPDPSTFPTSSRHQLFPLNPSGIVPSRPVLDLESPPGRGPSDGIFYYK